jgi:hypothetical protein
MLYDEVPATGLFGSPLFYLKQEKFHTEDTEVEPVLL